MTKKEREVFLESCLEVSYIKLLSRSRLPGKAEILCAKEFCDIYSTYHIGEIIGGELMTAPLKKNFLEVVGLLESEIDVFRHMAIKAAMKKFPADITRLDEKIREVGKALGGEFDEFKDLDEPVYVISTTEHTFGASAILYPGVLEEVSDIFYGDFYLIPSSIHEWLAVPKRKEKVAEDVAMLKKIMSEVSADKKCVSAGEFMSDELYGYNHKTKKIYVL